MKVESVAGKIPLFSKRIVVFVMMVPILTDFVIDRVLAFFTKISALEENL